ncbi:TPA: outer membrane usher protein [Citrobacter werkmanii]
MRQKGNEKGRGHLLGGACVATITFVAYGLVSTNSDSPVAYSAADFSDADVQKINNILYAESSSTNASHIIQQPARKMASVSVKDKIPTAVNVITDEVPAHAFIEDVPQPVTQPDNITHQRVSGRVAASTAANSVGHIVQLPKKVTKKQAAQKQEIPTDEANVEPMPAVVQRHKTGAVHHIPQTLIAERGPDSSFSHASTPGGVAPSISRVPAVGHGVTERGSATGDEKVEFDSRFLKGNAKHIDVSRYADGNPVTPGNYNLDIFVNDRLRLNSLVVYVDDGDSNVYPCLTEKTLMQLGAKYSIKNIEGIKHNGEVCYNVLKVIPGINANFNQEKQELNLSIPQLYIEKVPDGYIDPALWDNGVTAAMLSYDLNAYHSDSSGDASDSLYTGLRYGLNLGNWRLRGRGALNWESTEKASYNSQEAWLQRDIAAIKSQFVIGQSSTRGDTFDSIAVKGIHLYNDDRMLTGSESGYAPTIKGVANTNAKVTVRQNGNIVKQVTVSPGPFAITDINPSGFGNDLDVTVTEADGREQHFSVPFSSVSQLLREDSIRWEMALGQLDQDGLYHSPDIATASLYYGLTDALTSYAGFQSTDEDYNAFLLGTAVNTSLGAFAFDATQSYATLPGIGKWQGNSYRLTYSQQLAQSKTSINLAAWRYASEHYLSLTDATNIYDQLEHTQNQTQWVLSDYQRLKEQLQLNVSQPLDYGDEDFGSLYANASWNRYWSQKSNTQYSLGYSNSFRWGTYSITAQRSYDESDNADDSVYLSFNLPFEKLSPAFEEQYGFTQLNTGLRSDSDGSSQLDASANGNSSDKRYSYSLNTSYSVASNQQGSNLAQVGGNINYSGSLGLWSTSLSGSDQGDKQMSLGTSGGMILYHGGIVFVPESLDSTNTIALVSAPGAEGSNIGSSNSQINHSGYGAVTNLSPYHRNRVNIDISKLDNSIGLDNTSATVIPDAGAVVEVSFKTKVGTPYVFDIMTNDHSYIPFGADVYNEKDEWLSAVGQGGKVLLRGMNNSGILHIKWGKGAEQQCYVRYHLPVSNDKKDASMLLPAMLCTPHS